MGHAKQFINKIFKAAGHQTVPFQKWDSSFLFYKLSTSKASESKPFSFPLVSIIQFNHSHI